MKNVLVAILFLCIVLMPVYAAQTQNTDSVVTIINYQDKSVFSGSCDLDAVGLYEVAGVEYGEPLSFSSGGREFAAVLVEEGGRKFVRIFFSLEAFERINLEVAGAKDWSGVEPVVFSNADKDSGNASLSNGIIKIDYKTTEQLKNKWDMSLAGNLEVLKEVEYLCFFDNDPLRGRTPRDKAIKLGLPDSYNGRVVDMQTTTDNGEVSLKVVKEFDGIAKDIVLVETFTLLSGEPVLKYNLNYTNKSDESLYLGFIYWEGCIKGKFGDSLIGKKLLSCPWEFGREQIIDKYNRVLLRFGPGWAEPRSWGSVEAASGIGLGVTTTKELTEHHYLGASIWVFSTDGFQIDLTETTSGYYPVEIPAGKTIDMGICLSPSQAGMNSKEQVNKVFDKVRAGSLDSGRFGIDSAVAVLLDGKVVTAALNNGIADLTVDGLIIETGDKKYLPLVIDPSQEYVLTGDITGNKKTTIRLRSLDGDKVLEIAKISENGKFNVELPGRLPVTNNMVLEISDRNATINSLSFEKRVPHSPVITSPFDGQSITDIASFFRWKSVEGVREYELQLSRDIDFESAESKSISFIGNLPHYMPIEPLETGKWYWRVCAIAGNGRSGDWSKTYSLVVNDDHSFAELIRPITPQMPLFSLEVWRVRDLSYFKDTLPPELKPYCVVSVNYTGDYMLHKKGFEEYFAPTKKYDIPIMIEANSPMGINDQFPSLAEVEWLFQNYPNVIAAYGGENMQGLSSNLPYVRNLLRLCVKYGRLFMQGDGNYSTIKLHQIGSDKKVMELIKKCSKYIVLAQKNNIWHSQHVTQSSVMGMWLAGVVDNIGSWEDGGWYWEQVGMRKLGEWYGRRSGELEYMPPIFWVLTWIHGMNSGSSVLFAEGQPGSTIDCYSKNPFKEIPNAIWDNKGKTTEVFTRYVEPFLRAVAEHQLVPTKEEVLEDVKLAVLQDKPHETEVYSDEDFYGPYTALYCNTYGFDEPGADVYEYFPNTGRYYYFPLLPYGTGKIKRADGSEVAQVKMSDMRDGQKVKQAFGNAYEKQYEGDALVTMPGDKVFIINTNENKDITQSYKIKNPGGSKLVSMAGKIGPHAYLVGKGENGGRSFWLQTNTAYPQRDTELKFECVKRPQIKAVPQSSLKENKWDSENKTLYIKLSHLKGVAELTLIF